MNVPFALCSQHFCKAHGCIRRVTKHETFCEAHVKRLPEWIQQQLVATIDLDKEMSEQPKTFRRVLHKAQELLANESE